MSIITCTAPNGYVSHESEWEGYTYGSDSTGSSWSRWNWQGIEVESVKPSER
jgi:hypothetical protein